MSDSAEFETWLSGSTEDAFKFARSYAAELMHIVQSVRSVRICWPRPTKLHHLREELNGRWGVQN